MKDALKLTAAIVMAFSAKKKNIWLQNFKNNWNVVFYWQFHCETDDKAQIFLWQDKIGS